MKLYNFYVSPPARSATMLAKLTQADCELVSVNLGKGEQYQPDFLKINPSHQGPALVDDGFCLSENRAICTYLIAL